MGKNRLHVDLVSPDRAADIQRAIAAGANHIGDFDEYGTAWTTLADPEGNLFDIGDGLGVASRLRRTRSIRRKWRLPCPTNSRFRRIDRPRSWAGLAHGDDGRGVARLSP